MLNHVRVLAVPDADRAELQRRAKDQAAPARVAERARIAPLSAAGPAGPQIAEHAGCGEPTVIERHGQVSTPSRGRPEQRTYPAATGPVTVLPEDAAHRLLAATLTVPAEVPAAGG